MTCIIGARGADGCVIVSDSRITRGYETTNESKIHELWEKVVIAGAGTTPLIDKFTTYISKSKIPQIPDFEKVINTTENVIFSLRNRYEKKLGREFSIELLMMGLDKFDKGEPYIRLIHQKGITEEVRTYSIIGHGAPYIALLYGLLYDQMLTVEELAVLGYFCIDVITKKGLDQSVGTDEYGPETIALRTDGKPEWLIPENPMFSNAKESLKHMKFGCKLISSIWNHLPQAYEAIDHNLIA